MDKKEAQEIIDNVYNFFEDNEGVTLACWSAIYNDCLHHHVRGDLLFLNFLREENGEIIFRRIRPTLLQKGITGGPELYYNHNRLVMIKNGERKGKVLPEEYLHDDESYVPSGIQKFLRYKIDSNSFHVNRKGDVASLELMRALCKDISSASKRNAVLNDVRNIEEISPDLFLVSAMGREVLKSRRTGATRNWLTNLKTDEDEDLDATSIRVAPKYSSDAGPGKVAYPFEHYYGRGIVAASLQSDSMKVGSWYSINRMEGNRAGIVFDCEM